MAQPPPRLRWIRILDAAASAKRIQNTRKVHCIFLLAVYYTGSKAAKAGKYSVLTRACGSSQAISSIYDLHWCLRRGGHLGANEPTVALKCVFFGPNAIMTITQDYNDHYPEV